MKNISNILSIIIIIGLGWFIRDYVIEKENSKTYKSNQTQLLNDLDSLKSNLVSLEFTKDEMIKYLKNNDSEIANVIDKIEDQNIALKRIDKIIATSINAVDTTKNVIILDSIGRILEAINEDKILQIPFEDKSNCFSFKANFILEDGTSRIEVLDRTYNDTLYHVSYWERNQWKLFGLIKTRAFGKKIAKVTIFNDCGFSKQIIITKRQ